MSDQPTGQVPDPTTATTVADLVERLKLLHSWAGEPSAEELQALGATGSTETYVAACLRARQWAPTEIEREVVLWQAVARRVAFDPTQELPIVAAAAPPPESPPPESSLAESPPPESLPEPPAASPAAEPSVAPPPPRGWPNVRLVLTAACAVVLVLVAVPMVLIRTGGGPAPAALAVTSPSPSPSLTAPPSGPEPPVAGQAGAAKPSPSPSPSPSPAGVPPPPLPPPPPATGPAPAPSSRQPAPPAPSPSPSPPPPPPPPRPWSSTVDNTSGRFSAGSSWDTASNSNQHYGANFRYARPNTEQSDAAWYRFNLPRTGRYRVEAWFPAKSSYNDRTPFVIVTASGNQTVHRSQRTNGGRWVSLGTFTLAAGDYYAVGVSRWASGDRFSRHINKSHLVC